jgi:GTP-binding protein
MGILVENMRREGFELMLSRPEVVTRKVDGVLHEPLERLYVDCPKDCVGSVTELLGQRRGKLDEMSAGESTVRLVYCIPTRGLIGFHSEFLTETRGMGIANVTFEGWTPWQGDIPQRRTGSLVADRTGTATPYALFHLQPRGVLFIDPGDRVYEGMVIGETPSGREIDVNATRQKKLTNVRAAGKDENVILSRPKRMSLEQYIEFIDDDEFIEVTPHHLRVRKRSLRASSRHKRLYGRNNLGSPDAS